MNHSDQGNVFKHVRSCDCLTFDRVRCARVASILRVYVWLGWLGLLTVGQSRQPTK